MHQLNYILFLLLETPGELLSHLSFFPEGLIIKHKSTVSYTAFSSFIVISVYIHNPSHTLASQFLNLLSLNDFSPHSAFILYHTLCDHSWDPVITNNSIFHNFNFSCSVLWPQHPLILTYFCDYLNCKNFLLQLNLPPFIVPHFPQALIFLPIQHKFNCPSL